MLTNFKLPPPSELKLLSIHPISSFFRISDYLTPLAQNPFEDTQPYIPRHGHHKIPNEWGINSFISETT